MKTYAHPAPHWGPLHLRALSAAASFERLAEISLAVMDDMGPPVVMLSGPISTGGKGSLDENIRTFVRAIEHVTRQGKNVFSQMPAEDVVVRLAHEWRTAGGTGYCMPILDVFYSRLFRSGKVGELVLIPGWQSSRGARWEHELCSELGITISHLPEYWEADLSAKAVS